MVSTSSSPSLSSSPLSACSSEGSSAAACSRVCFVTVGTTNFDGLLELLDRSDDDDDEEDDGKSRFVQALYDRGFRRLIVQYGGTSKYQLRRLPLLFGRSRVITSSSLTSSPPASSLSASDDSAVAHTDARFPDMSFEAFPLHPNIPQFLSTADLVISHAGAGSVLEALRLRCTVLVVVNPTLMNNHQLELARMLASQRYVYMASPVTFLSVLPAVCERLFGNSTSVHPNESDREDGADDARDWSHADVIHVNYPLQPYPPIDAHAFVDLIQDETSPSTRAPSASATSWTAWLRSWAWSRWR